MKFSSLRLALLAGLVLPLGLASASLAQDAPPAPPPAGAPGMHHDHHWGGGDPAARGAHMAEHLSAALQLQPSQQAALAAYIGAMKPPEDMKARMDARRAEDAHLSTPERLDKMLAHFDERRAHMVARAEATKQFYSQLSPGQQKAFDALAPMMMHRFGGHDRGGMRGGPDGGGPDGGGHDGGAHDGGGWGHRMGPDGQSPG